MEKYYVSIDGSDSNPGTKQHPFKTFERAEDVAGESGEVIDILIVD